MSWSVTDLAARIYVAALTAESTTAALATPADIPGIMRSLAESSFTAAQAFAVEASKRDPATGKLKNVWLPTDVDDGDVSEGEW